MLLLAGLACHGESLTILQPPRRVWDKGLTTGDFKNGLVAQDPLGCAAVLRVSQTVWWEVDQALVRFDLSCIPEDMRVARATLEMHVAELRGDAMKVRVCQVAPYDEWDPMTATFETRDGEHPWSGGAVAGSTWAVLDSVLVGKADTWCAWDVTKAVRAVHERKVADSGFLLQADYRFNTWGDLDNSPGQVCFHSSDGPDAELYPRLKLELEPMTEEEAQVRTRRPPAPRMPAELLRAPRPPYVIWYQCPYLDDLKHCNLDASVGSMRWAFENHARGIASLMWTYGPNSPYAEGPEYYTQQYTGVLQAGYVGCAVDEWNVPAGDKQAEWCAQGLREAKGAHPEGILAVWVTHLTPAFISLVREGVIDLALIEGYTYVPEHPEWAISWDGLIARVELMKREGLLGKTIVCVGMVAARPDSHSNRMTPEELKREVEYLARHYPEMPGIAFYGWNDQDPQTKQLVLLADELAGRLYRVSGGG